MSEHKWLTSRRLQEVHLYISPELNWNSAPVTSSYPPGLCGRRQRPAQHNKTVSTGLFIFIFSLKSKSLKIVKMLYAPNWGLLFCMRWTSIKSAIQIQKYFLHALKKKKKKSVLLQGSACMHAACHTASWHSQHAALFIKKNKDKKPYTCTLFTFICTVCLIRPDLSPRGKNKGKL